MANSSLAQAKNSRRPFAPSTPSDCKSSKQTRTARLPEVLDFPCAQPTRNAPPLTTGASEVCNIHCQRRSVAPASRRLSWGRPAPTLARGEVRSPFVSAQEAPIFCLSSQSRGRGRPRDSGQDAGAMFDRASRLWKKNSVVAPIVNGISRIVNARAKRGQHYRANSSSLKSCRAQV